MLAVRLERFTNSPGTVRATDAPKPVPADGEVLVEIQAAGVNPSDVINIRGGFDHTVLPRIVGRDFAGRVVEGPPHLLGRDVWGCGGGELGYTKDGTHAQFLAIERDGVALRPASLSADEAASAGVPFVTAWHALVQRSQLARGSWVLVSGAAGSVGYAAVQIARYAGAKVVALVKDETEIDLLDRSAVAAIARSDRGDVAQVVRDATGGEGCDVALNTVGASIFHDLDACLCRGGRMAIISAAGGREVTFDLKRLYREDHALIGVNTANLSAAQCAQMLAEMSAAFESGFMTPQRISDRRTLEHANEAYELAEHPNSKVVLLAE